MLWLKNAGVASRSRFNDLVSARYFLLDVRLKYDVFLQRGMPCIKFSPNRVLMLRIQQELNQNLSGCEISINIRVVEPAACSFQTE